MGRPCEQCGMRIRKNQPWHEVRHMFVQSRGNVMYEVYDHKTKQVRWKWAA